MVGEDYLVLSQRLIVYMGIVTTGISTLVAKFQRLKQKKKSSVRICKNKYRNRIKTLHCCVKFWSFILKNALSLLTEKRRNTAKKWRIF